MSIIRALDGVIIARGDVNEKCIALTILSPSGFVGDAYYPAESITTTDIDGLMILREMLDELITQHQQMKDALELPKLPAEAFRL